MTDQDTDDIFDQIAPERERRPRKKLPKGLLRLIVALAAIVVVAVVIVILVTSLTGRDETAEYQSYMNSIESMLERSDAVGEQVSGLLMEPGDTTRKEIQTRLDQAIATSQALEAEAAALAVPEELVQQNIHQFFVLVMHFRAKGMADLKPSLMNALELQDVEVPSEQISRALTYLSNSDFLYEEVFQPKTAEILKVKDLADVTVPDTQFLSDSDLASKVRVQEILAVLKSTGNLQAVHGVALSKVMASPDDKEITDGKTYNLTSSDELAFLVSVENQGNMAEKDVPVVVTLVSPDSTEPQVVTVTIPELKPNEEAHRHRDGSQSHHLWRSGRAQGGGGAGQGREVPGQQLPRSQRHLHSIGAISEHTADLRNRGRDSHSGRGSGGHRPRPGVQETSALSAQPARHHGIAGHGRHSRARRPRSTTRWPISGWPWKT